jgi:hypothetical protein
MAARSLLTVIAGAALALPATADAARVTIGSSLAAPATLRETWPVDTAFWAQRIAGGGAIASPVEGQAIITRLKGTAVARPGGSAPLRLIHFQVLRPQSDGSAKVIVTSEDFNIPASGDPNQVSEYASAFLCVRKGDVIALSEVGGYEAGSYPNGVPFQVFGDVAGSVTNRFTGAGRNMNGDVMRPTARNGSELLLQTVIGTGPDARPFCGGSASTPTPGNEPPAQEPGGGGGTGGGGAGTATVPVQTLRVRNNRIKVRVRCTGGRCSDRLVVSYKSSKVAGKAFTLASGTSATYGLRLTTFGRALLRANGGRATVKLNAGGKSRRLIMRRAA